MEITTGKVVDGKVVIDGAPLVEGARVTILVPAADSGFTLNEDERKLLAESIAEIERGEFISGDELLRRIDKRS